MTFSEVAFFGKGNGDAYRMQGRPGANCCNDFWWLYHREMGSPSEFFGYDPNLLFDLDAITIDYDPTEETFTVSLEGTVVPEPSSGLLVALGPVALGVGKGRPQLRYPERAVPAPVRAMRCE